MATSMMKRDVVLDSVTPLLQKLGLRKRKGGVYTVELSKQVHGWLGLNRATRHLPPGEVEISPVVGVSHVTIERLLAELRGAKPHGYQVATIATPLGYLLPEARYKAWAFSADNAHETAAEMVGAIARYGVPFMRSKAELSEICRALESPSDFAFEDHARYLRPLALLVAGDLARSAEELDKGLAVLGDRHDAAAIDFRRFAAALRAHISAS
jgi:hypothetical protein